jgi:hypothetical protein
VSFWLDEKRGNRLDNHYNTTRDRKQAVMTAIEIRTGIRQLRIAKLGWTN